MRGKEEENAHSTTTTHSPAQPPRLRPTNAALAAAAGQGPLSLSHRKLRPLAGQVPGQSPKLQSMSLALQPRTPQPDTPKGTVPRGRATSRRRHAQRPPAALLFTSRKHQRIHTASKQNRDSCAPSAVRRTHYQAAFTALAPKDFWLFSKRELPSTARACPTDTETSGGQPPRWLPKASSDAHHWPGWLLRSRQLCAQPGAPLPCAGVDSRAQGSVRRFLSWQDCRQPPRNTASDTSFSSWKQTPRRHLPLTCVCFALKGGQLDLKRSHTWGRSEGSWGKGSGRHNLRMPHKQERVSL